jgi:hypothetical protein
LGDLFGPFNKPLPEATPEQRERVRKLQEGRLAKRAAEELDRELAGQQERQRKEQIWEIQREIQGIYIMMPPGWSAYAHDVPDRYQMRVQWLQDDLKALGYGTIGDRVEEFGRSLLQFAIPGYGLGAARVEIGIEQQLAGAANRAIQTVGPGKGGVWGTNVHSAFKHQVDALGNPSLFTEVSYLNGMPVTYGTKGSVRADVVQGSVTFPTVVYDLKTGGAVLSVPRIKQLQAHIPGGKNVPIHEIHP